MVFVKLKRIDSIYIILINTYKIHPIGYVYMMLEFEM